MSALWSYLTLPWQIIAASSADLQVAVEDVLRTQSSKNLSVSVHITLSKIVATFPPKNPVGRAIAPILTEHQLRVKINEAHLP